MRRMLILTSGGVETVPVRDAETASAIGRFWNGVQSFLGSGDPRVLDEFAGIAIRGHRLETDPDAIEDFALAGQLDILEIYDLPPGETRP